MYNVHVHTYTRTCLFVRHAHLHVHCTLYMQCMWVTCGGLQQFLSISASILYTHMKFYVHIIHVHCMFSPKVQNERLSLLQHPLIYRYINYKWWKLSFPLFFIYIFFYGLFLIFLTTFTVILPRPGPNDDYCKWCHTYTI